MKPIEIRPAGDGFTVHVHGEIARAYGAKRRKSGPVHGAVVMGRKGHLDVSADGTPLVFDLDDAKHVAHQIGRYMLGFGDLTFSYTSGWREF